MTRNNLTSRYNTYSVVEQPVLQLLRVDFVIRVKHVRDVIDELGEKTEVRSERNIFLP